MKSKIPAYSNLVCKMIFQHPLRTVITMKKPGHLTSSNQGEIHAYSDLIRKTIYQHPKLNKVCNRKIKNYEQEFGGINAGQIPPHPPSKKAVFPDHSQGGFSSEIEGWHCSSWEVASGGLRPQGEPWYPIPLASASCFITLLPPLLHVPP